MLLYLYPSQGTAWGVVNVQPVATERTLLGVSGGRATGWACVSFMVSSALTQQRAFLRALGFVTATGSFPALSQPSREVLTLSSTSLEGNTQAQSGRGAQSRSHSTPRSRAKARTWSLPDQCLRRSSGRCGLRWDSALVMLTASIPPAKCSHVTWEVNMTPTVSALSTVGSPEDMG